jgi:hypothetical protein
MPGRQYENALHFFEYRAFFNKKPWGNLGEEEASEGGRKIAPDLSARKSWAGPTVKNFSHINLFLILVHFNNFFSQFAIIFFTMLNTRKSRMIVY